jgi:hypothetical protein
LDEERLMIVVTIARSLAAGASALLANFALLTIADRFGIVTARGGFQRLVKQIAGPYFIKFGIDRQWTLLALPAPQSAAFVVGFKIAVGLGMALAYGLGQKYFPGTPVQKGLAYALLVWLINACVVLPALGEGFAGTSSLTPIGITAFAIAHTSFFIVLALLV